MEDLFRSYWWLLFPLAFFVASAFDQWMRYRRHRDTLDLIKSYASQGKDPPPELMARLNAADVADDDDDDDRDDRRRARRYRRYRRYRGYSSWSSVVLFGVMAAGFGFAASSDIYHAQGAFLLVTFVMLALCLSSLVGILTSRRD